MTEPRIDGMEMRNANSTANSLFNPAIRPPKSVDPDLETPGHIAMPCMHPMNMACLHFISIGPLSFLPILSATKRMIPVRLMKMTGKTMKRKKSPSTSWKNTP